MDIIENLDDVNFSNEENNENPNALQEAEVQEEVLRVPYEAASESCDSLDSYVPIGFASEQTYFNNRLKSTYDVAEYVKDKLKYKTIDDLCKAFSKEQIDGIATAIFNWESTGKAIIISDQTGLGKGRMIAGLIRFSILTLKKFPVFFTESSNLFSDIYRDLFDIGFEANIPIAIKTKPTFLQRDEITRELLLSELKKDIEEEELRIDYNLDDDLDFSDLFKAENEDILDEVLELYADYIEENGVIIGDEYTYLLDDITDKQIKKIIKKDIEENNALRFSDIELTEAQISNLFTAKYEKLLLDVIKSYKSNLSIKQKQQDAMKEGRYRINPIVPFKLDITNKSGDLLFQVTDKDAKKFIQDMQVPATMEQFSLFCVKYSTLGRGFFNRKTNQKSPKGLFIEKFCKDRVVLLDEVHNAAGSKSKVDRTTGQVSASNTFMYLSYLIRNSKYVTYISATWAKRSDNIPIYALATAIQDSKLSTSQLINAFASGGLALQEMVSSALVKDGQLIRRERDVKAIVDIPLVELGDEDNPNPLAQSQLVRLDRMAEIWSNMTFLYQELKDTFKAQRENLTLQGEGFSEEEILQIGEATLLSIVKDRYKLRANLNTQLSRLFEYFIISLKTQQAIQYALEELNVGRKVVIAISNTFASQFDNIKRDYQQSLPYKFGDVVPNDLVEMFKGQLARLLGFTYRGVKVLDDGTKAPFETTISLFDEKIDDYGKPNFRLFINALNGLKSDFANAFESYSNIGIPLSPLDVIRAKVGKDFSIDEITGRTKMLEFEDNNYSEGILSKREKQDKMTLVNKFNANELDALIINVSGATGLSLHALETIVQGKVVAPVNIRPKEVPKSLLPKNEVKGRTMIILQMEKDIAKEMQKLGRINRNGQAYIPKYIYVNSIIPSEARYNAMAQKKLKSLMSMTAGNQNFGKDIFNYDDFLSDFGIDAWNQTIRELRYPEKEYKVKGVEQLKTKSKFLYFLSYNEQERFYSTLRTNLNKEIEIAIKSGNYNTKVEYENFLAQTEQVLPYIITTQNSTTIFGSNVFAEIIKIKKYVDINDERKIKRIIDDYYTRFDNVTSKYISDIDGVKKRRLNDITSNQKIYFDEQKALIENQQIQISDLENQIKVQDEKLKKYPIVEDIIELDRKIKEYSEEKEKYGKDILLLIESGDTEKTAELSRKVAQLKGDIDSLTKSRIEKAGEISVQDLQSQYKETERAIRYAKEGIENRQRQIQRINDDIAEQENILKLYQKYQSNIGKIIDISFYQIDKNFRGYDDSGNEIYEYTAVKSSTSKAVLTKVSAILSGRNDLILSNITISYTDETSNDIIPLSAIESEISAENKALGLRNKVEVTFTDLPYEENWTNYIKNYDNAYFKQEVVLSGDLLKATAFKSFLKLSGKIVKYTTYDNRLKTSFLLDDDSKKEIENAQGLIDNNLPYGLIFSMNKENTKNIISTMVAKAILVSLQNTYLNLERVVENVNGSRNVISLQRMTFASQIYYDQSYLFILAYPNLELLNELDNLIKEKNFDQSLFNDNSMKAGFIKIVSAYIYENFEKLRFIFTAQQPNIISQFFDLLNDKLKVQQYQNGNELWNGSLLLESDNSPQITIMMDSNVDAKYQNFVSGYIERIDNGSGYEQDNFHKTVYNFSKNVEEMYGKDVNNGMYAVDSVLLESRDVNANNNNSNQQIYFKPNFSIGMTSSALDVMLNFFEKGLNIEMLSATSSDCLTYSVVPYVFNVETSSLGTIQKIEMPDNIGDKKVQAIEDIIDEFVKYYLNN